MTFAAADPDFAARVGASFARQRVMAMLGASLVRVDAGRIDIELPYREDLSQQHGFLHAGIVATVLDSACGYAAFSLMPPQAAVLSIEYKINLLAPAKGDRLIASAEVLKPGRTITVCEGRARMIGRDGEKLVASMTGTIMAVYDRPGVES